jgi:hypothetical protein
MTRNPPSDFSDSLYYRAIQTKIGEALRTRLVPTEPASDQILKAPHELDHQQEDHATEEKQDSATQGSSKTKGDK